MNARLTTIKKKGAKGEVPVFFLIDFNLVEFYLPADVVKYNWMNLEAWQKVVDESCSILKIERKTVFAKKANGINECYDSEVFIPLSENNAFTWVYGTYASVYLLHKFWDNYDLMFAKINREKESGTYKAMNNCFEWLKRQKVLTRNDYFQPSTNFTDRLLKTFENEINGVSQH